jgi:hypothetical protein
MLDLGYGDAIEREEAERADLDSEDAHALLHGEDSPYSFRDVPGQALVATDGVQPDARRCSRVDGPSVKNPSVVTSATPSCDSHDTDSLVSTSLRNPRHLGRLTEGAGGQQENHIKERGSMSIADHGQRAHATYGEAQAAMSKAVEALQALEPRCLSEEHGDLLRFYAAQALEAIRLAEEGS